MKWLPGLALALAAASANAVTAWVSDELVLGVYSEKNQHGDHLATVHSGTVVEIVSREDDFTQVKLADGTTGWVKSSYLITHEPAAARVKQLEDELNRQRSGKTAPDDAAARSEIENLKQRLQASQTELASLHAQEQVASSAAVPQPAEPDILRMPLRSVQPDTARTPALRRALATVAGMFVAAALGFAAGYATLARRVRHKFGGVKVY